MTDVQPPGVDEVRKAAYRVADAVRAVEDALAYTPANQASWDDLRWSAKRLSSLLRLAPERLDDAEPVRLADSDRPRVRRAAPAVLPDGGAHGNYRRADRERLLAAGWRRVDILGDSRCWVPPGCDGGVRSERRSLAAALAALDAEQQELPV
ncbi:hypothetical protein GCE86_06675 [Micromonospora terminaliae]|uniref:Uncharacterized protein n=1 Tax=Micromonospora terminaliae TaxID=1914461 RepID=A0AAJ2ZHN6_9ACTN|nr:hypothetical protein [Micromonospora terminaliae]NES30067.1 hypothetical protein [Micromonospora terminaliae]QGL46760.1 hypothetical protein GCE86_06675 [Micromonospora terminaliae]